MTIRVVQWATGAMGTACLRMILDDPALELVGLRVYDQNKIGVDAGTIAGRPSIGVLATDDLDTIVSSQPDVVVHAARLGPYGSHDDDLVDLLRRGINVISINGYSNPTQGGGDRVERLQRAAVTGGATLVGAGLNPGFAAEQLAVVLSGLTTRVDRIVIEEHADSSLLRDPAYIFEVLGFGADPATVDLMSGTAAALDGMFAESLGALASQLGMTVERIESDHVAHVVPHDLELRAGTVKAGTVSHTNWRWHAVVDGRPTLTMSIHWFVDRTHLAQPDPPLWQVHVVGHPSVKVTLELGKHPDDTTKMGAESYAVAAEVVNTIPWVVEAAPGLARRPPVTPHRADRA